MKTETYSVGAIAATVETYSDGSFRLKFGQSTSRVFPADQIGFLQADGVCFFYGHNEQTGLLPGVPYLGLPTTVV